jgi:hypothetical protein
MIPLTKVRYYLSDKGLQDKTSVLILDPKELQIARNVHFYETGSWTSRGGYAKRWTNVLSGAPILTGQYEFVKRDGTKKFIASADKLYYGADGDTAGVEIAGGLTFTTGSNGENLMSFITFANKTIGTNGVEALWQYDGTTASTLAGSPPICPIIANYQNFVFIAGNSTYPYRLYFSNDGDETTWDGTDYIDIGDLTAPITGLAVAFGKLYIFTRKGMYELRGYDRDTFIVDEVSTSTGCVARKSIVKVDNNLIFLTDRGIYSFDGINVHYLSGKIQTYIEGLNYSRVPYVVAELYKAKNQVWLSVSTGSNGANNNVICMTYDPTASETLGIKKNDVAFAIYTGMAFNSFGLETSDTELDRLFAGSYTGYVFKQDYGNNDNGSGIDFVVKPNPIDFGEPETFKRFRYIKLFTKQEGDFNLTISYKTDFKPGTSTTTMNMQQTTDASLWGSMIWGASTWGGSSIINDRLGFKASGNHLELIFSHSTKDQQVVIKGFTLYAQMKGLR